MPNAGQTFVIRTETRGEAGKALHAVRVALGPTIRLLPVAPSAE